MKRREFFKNAFGVSGLIVAAPVILATLHAGSASAEESRRKKAPDAGGDMLDPKDATAVAVGYVTDATKSKKAAGQNCTTCSLYKATGPGVGSCPIFGKKLVLGKAYCNSFAKKG